MGSGGGVDVVHADTGTTYQAEFGSGLQQLGVDLDSRADDERVGVRQLGGEAVFNLVGGNDLPAGLLLKDGEGGGRNFFGEDDLHAFSVAGRVTFRQKSRAVSCAR